MVSPKKPLCLGLGKSLNYMSQLNRIWRLGLILWFIDTGEWVFVHYWLMSVFDLLCGFELVNVE